MWNPLLTHTADFFRKSQLAAEKKKKKKKNKDAFLVSF